MRLRLEELLVDHYGENAPILSIKSAHGDLWRKLRRGALNATAIKRPTRSRVKIPVEAWDDLEVTEEQDKDVPQRMQPWSPHGLRYDEVLFASADVRELWPYLQRRLDKPPVLIPIEGQGFTPLFCAAHWIATRGSRIDVGWDIATLEDVYAELLARIAAGKIELLGTRNGVRERVDGFHVADCRVVYPFDDHGVAGLTLGSNLVLFSCPLNGDVRWTDGMDDNLRDESGLRWSRLLVRREQIASVWHFHRPAEVVDVETYRTGGPERPSSAHFVTDEFEKCCRRGEIRSTLAAQARELEAWLIKTHPQVRRQGKPDRNLDPACVLASQKSREMTITR